MNLTRIYRQIVPEKIRKSLYKAFVKQLLDISDFIKYKGYYLFFSVFTPKTEKNECNYFLGKYSIVNYPYPYYFEYMKKDIKCYTDLEKNLPYVIHNNRKLYFKKMSEARVLEAYKMLLMEQDLRSAHCYVDNYETLKGKTILDVGAAEGIFSLNAIDFVDHIYLFECEKDWIEPLRATFEPVKDKITIVEKYVSDTSDGEMITLDNFFGTKIPDNLFVKMDIEGFERKALKGCENLFLNGRNISGAICTYHRDDDEKVITSILKSRKSNVTKTNGYIYNERSLRTGVVRFQPLI